MLRPFTYVKLKNFPKVENRVIKIFGLKNQGFQNTQNFMLSSNLLRKLPKSSPQKVINQKL
jgi:hypothetical protein